MPEYIRLCMHTWMLAIPELDLEIINHDNISDYLPAEMLTPSFYNLSLAMQSDIVSVLVLNSRGGIFIDADTIITSNPFECVVFQSDKLTAFGYPDQKTIHLAVICSAQPNNPVLEEWAKEIRLRLSKELPKDVSWDYVGNGIVNSLLADEKYSNEFYIIDAKKSGNILEFSSKKDNPYLRYLDFYFNKPVYELGDVLGKVHFGIISLHNSWTPEVYRKASLEVLVKSKESVFLSNFLLHIIDLLTQKK